MHPRNTHVNQCEVVIFIKFPEMYKGENIIRSQQCLMFGPQEELAQSTKKYLTNEPIPLIISISIFTNKIPTIFASTYYFQVILPEAILHKRLL